MSKKTCVARLVLLFLIVAVWAAPATAAKKVTVQELSAMLNSWYADKKTDEEISGQLKQMEMREELILPVLNSYSKFNLGPLTIEQLTILQYASELQPLSAPTEQVKPIPDETDRKAILDRMDSYVSNVFSHVPDILVTKGTARFSDAPLSQIQDFRVSQGNGTLMGGTIRNVAGNYIRFHGITKVPMQVVDGVEKPISGKAGPANDPQGLIAWGQLGPILRTVVSDTGKRSTITWTRWDRINAIEVAVFDFNVDRKDSHYELNYCCFPNYDLSGGHVGPAQTIVDWKPFKSSVSYHGQLYVEPRTGYVLRLILKADPKPSDFVHQETTRVDYVTQTIDGKNYLLPKNLVTLNNVVISGDGGGQSYTEVHSILATEYFDFKLRPH